MASLLGGSPGEVYDFFDGPRPVSWDSHGNLAFSTRAKGASTLEKLIRVTGGNHQLVLQQNDPALGVIEGHFVQKQSRAAALRGALMITGSTYFVYGSGLLASALIARAMATGSVCPSIVNSAKRLE